MFNRNTSTPALISFRNISGDLHAGPTVATNLVRGRSEISVFGSARNSVLMVKLRSLLRIGCELRGNCKADRSRLAIHREFALKIVSSSQLAPALSA
jgi:hypothetical protein